MNHTRLTLDDFKSRLKAGVYSGNAGARRAISKMELTAAEKESAYLAANKYFSSTQKAATKVRANGTSSLAQQIASLKTKEVSWGMVAKQLGVARCTLRHLREGKPAAESTIKRVRELLEKDAQYKALIADGQLEQLSITPRMKSRKKSIIEHAPALAGLPSSLELDLQELALIRRLRAYQPPTAGQHLNGKRAT
jgi:hypothetical protein